MTRNGKIARIPRDIRNELNERLRDGELGNRLVEWLNGHPDVREVLSLYFEGRPVSEQNLSEWRLGGYNDWLRHQETLEFARTAAEEGEELQSLEDLQGNDGASPLSDRVAPLAVAVLIKRLRELSEGEAAGTPDARRDSLAVIRELTALRVSDHRAARLRMDLRRWEEEKAGIEKAADHRKLWERIDFVRSVRSREAAVQMLAEGMTPDQEERLRSFLNVAPRRRPANENGSAKSTPLNAAASPKPAIDGDGI